MTRQRPGGEFTITGDLSGAADSALAPLLLSLSEMTRPVSDQNTVQGTTRTTTTRPAHGDREGPQPAAQEPTQW